MDCDTISVNIMSKAERFEMLVTDHRQEMVRLAWRLLGSHHAAAEDVAQQAFMKAWDRFDTFREQSSLSTWLTRITVNQVRSYQRWTAVRHRARHLLRMDQKPTPVMRDHGLNQRIETAMTALSTNQREAFILVYLEGRAVSEVALCLGRSPGTVKSHLHRALTKLREELKDLKE